jgi:PIN domain nuclease of toxin-antitoxin system
MTQHPEIAVSDTHALIWWATGRARRLGKRARAFFEHVDEGRAVVCVPTMALVELSEAVQGGSVQIGEPFGEFVTRLAHTPSRYQVVPLSPEIVTRSHDLYLIPERGDRLIAATAATLGYPLITRDPAIATAGNVDLLW